MYGKLKREVEKFYIAVKKTACYRPKEKHFRSSLTVEYETAPVEKRLSGKMGHILT